MKKILVPTDFSKTAQGAFKYAQEFAERIGGATIDIVHVYLPEIVPEHPGAMPQVNEVMEVREKALRDFVVKNTAQTAGNVLTTHVGKEALLLGFPSDEIVERSGYYDFIVMGTTGEKGLLEKWFGSVSSTVAQRANCPVILVPKGVKFEGIEHILYATNFESAEDDMLEKLVELNKMLNANIHFVHVKDKSNSFEKTRHEIYEELFEDDGPSFSFDIQEFESDSIVEGLSDYAAIQDVDLVIMVSHRRNFWSNLFHKSQTKQMALNTKVPILVFHLTH